MTTGESIQARLARPFDAAQLRRIKRLWVRHSIAEDRRDIDGLIATLAPDCVYEIAVTGQRWEGHAGARAFYSELFAAFPDARVVQTHRDPVRVTASMATMAGYGLRMNVVPPPAAAIGRYWADRIERMLRANVRDRERVPRDRILDVGFDAFMADQPGTIARVHEFLGVAPSPDARAAIRRHLEAHPRGRRGAVRYRLDLLGLEESAGTRTRRAAAR